MRIEDWSRHVLVVYTDLFRFLPPSSYETKTRNEQQKKMKKKKIGKCNQMYTYWVFLLRQASTSSQSQSRCYNCKMSETLRRPFHAVWRTRTTQHADGKGIRKKKKKNLFPQTTHTHFTPLHSLGIIQKCVSDSFFFAPRLFRQALSHFLWHNSIGLNIIWWLKWTIVSD